MTAKQMTLEEIEAVRKAQELRWGTDLWNDENAALLATVDALRAENADLERIRQYAEARDKMLKDHVGKTIIQREADGSPCWSGRSPMLWLFDLCDEVLHLRRMKDILEEHVANVANREPKP